MRPNHLSAQTIAAVMNSVYQQLPYMKGRAVSNILYYLARLRWISNPAATTTTTSTKNTLKNRKGSSTSNEMNEKLINIQKKIFIEFTFEMFRDECLASFLGTCSTMTSVGEFFNGVWALGHFITWNELSLLQREKLQQNIIQQSKYMTARDLLTLSNAFRSFRVNWTQMPIPITTMITEKYAELIINMDSSAMVMTIFNLGSIGMQWSNFSPVTRVLIKQNIEKQLLKYDSKELYWLMCGLGRMRCTWDLITDDMKGKMFQNIHRLFQYNYQNNSFDTLEGVAIKNNMTPKNTSQILSHSSLAVMGILQGLSSLRVQWKELPIATRNIIESEYVKRLVCFTDNQAIDSFYNLYQLHVKLSDLSNTTVNTMKTKINKLIYGIEREQLINLLSILLYLEYDCSQFQKNDMEKIISVCLDTNKINIENDTPVLLLLRKVLSREVDIDSNLKLKSYLLLVSEHMISTSFSKVDLTAMLRAMASFGMKWNYFSPLVQQKLLSMASVISTDSDTSLNYNQKKSTNSNSNNNKFIRWVRGKPVKQYKCERESNAEYMSVLNKLGLHEKSLTVGEMNTEKILITDQRNHNKNEHHIVEDSNLITSTVEPIDMENLLILKQRLPYLSATELKKTLFAMARKKYPPMSLLKSSGLLDVIDLRLQAILGSVTQPTFLALCNALSRFNMNLRSDLSLSYPLFLHRLLTIQIDKNINNQGGEVLSNLFVSLSLLGIDWSIINTDIKQNTMHKILIIIRNQSSIGSFSTLCRSMLQIGIPMESMKEFFLLHFKRLFVTSICPNICIHDKELDEGRINSNLNNLTLPISFDQSLKKDVMTSSELSKVLECLDILDIKWNDLLENNLNEMILRITINSIGQFSPKVTPFAAGAILKYIRSGPDLSEILCQSEIESLHSFLIF